jgi:hypothetical protein
MAQAKMMIPSNVVERNMSLVKEIMRFLLENSQVFSSLPDKFELVVLPEDDPETRLYNLDLLDRYGSEGKPMRLYNLDLLDRYGSEGKPIVFARVKVQEESIAKQDRPSLYAPIEGWTRDGGVIGLGAIPRT